MGTNKLAFTREANRIFESTLPCSRSERINLKKSPKNKHLTYLYEERKKKVLYHWPQVDMVPILLDNLRKANYETPTPGITSLKQFWLNISFENALISAILNISSLEFELKFEKTKIKFSNGDPSNWKSTLLIKTKLEENIQTLLIITIAFC